MADPQLRCLLCDLVLADPSNPGQPTERCRQPGCGREILAGQSGATVDDLPVELTTPARPSSPPPAPLTPIFEDDDLPVANVVPKPPPLPPASSNIPTVQPRPRPEPPVAGKRPPAPVPPRRVTAPDPPRMSAPRPQIATALGVLGCMTLLIIICLSVIGYTILVGLKRASKKAEAPARPPALVVTYPG